MSTLKRGVNKSFQRIAKIPRPLKLCVCLNRWLRSGPWPSSAAEAMINGLNLDDPVYLESKKAFSVDK